MKLIVGPTNLQTELNFELFKKTNAVAGRLGFVDKIGVYTSGGLDSAALLCLILTELRLTNRTEVPVICFTIKKSDGPTYYVPRLLQKVEEHFNVKLTHVNDIPNDPIPDLAGNIGVGPIKFIKDYAPNMITYMGINRMAPDDIRPFKQQLKIDYGHNKVNSMYTSPFLFMHKPQILDILYQLGCEDLIQYTKSCSALPIGACGQCYACEERAWGFHALGKTDPGTLPMELR